MKKRTAQGLRKQPEQDRSVATVQAILEAAAYILAKEGWAKFTTNRIAERAGVNIASLYQFFPDKESIAVELQRRHIDKGRKAFPQFLDELRTQTTLRSVLSLMIQAGVDEHRLEPALHKAFAEELPRSARTRATNEEEQTLAQWTVLMRPYMKNVPSQDIALFLIRATVHAAIHEAATDRPEFLASPLFVDEVVTLVERYLTR